MKGYQDGTNVTAKFREPSGVAFTPTGTMDLHEGSKRSLGMRAWNVLMGFLVLRRLLMRQGTRSSLPIRLTTAFGGSISRHRRFEKVLSCQAWIHCWPSRLVIFCTHHTDARKRPGEHAGRPAYQGQHVCLRHLAAIWRLQCR